MNARLLFAAPLALLAFVASPAATPASPDRFTAMRRLDTWVGEWRGSGWSVDATGRRTEFSLTENVRSRVGGSVLLLEGHGTPKGAAEPEAVTHDGLALVWFDEHAARYRWIGHELRNGAIEPEVQPIDGGLQWTLPSAGATLRFTIRVDEHHWHEVGELSADGKAWSPFMEMELERGG